MVSGLLTNSEYSERFRIFGNAVAALKVAMGRFTKYPWGFMRHL